jgi:two-component system chemotaxis sensor kinase CheA
MNESAFERLLAFIDARLPPGFADDDELRRARLALLFSWALTALAPVFVANDLQHHRFGNAAGVLLAVPFGLFAAQVFRATRSLTFMGNYVAAIFGGVLGARSLMTGGITAFAPFWMSSLPVMALLIAGRRSAFVWLGLCVAFFGALFGGTLAGVQWADGWSLEERQREFFIATTMLGGLMLMLASLFEAAKEAMRRRVARRERDIRRMLDVMGQGFITVSREGIIIGPHSAALEQWFGAPKEGARFSDYLATQDANAGRWLTLAFEALVDDLLPLELLLEQFPRRVTRGAQSFQLEARPALRRDGSLELVVVVLTDITAQLQREAAEAEHREMLQVLDKALADRRGFILFFTEAERLVAEVRADGNLRAVHTLKGNSALFGASTVALLCHTLESQAVEAGASRLTPEDGERLGQAFEAFARRVAKLVSTRRDVLEVPTEEVESLRSALQAHLSYEQLDARVSGWVLEPVRLPLERLAQQARALATRLGRAEPVVELDDGGVRLKSEAFGPLWAVCAHLVRNAVDHGLEMAQAREQHGKPAAGRLSFRARRDGEYLHLDIGDDGKGVDWGAVTKLARLRGLPAESRGDLEQALLSDGFSTATEVSDVSGRGIGLSAVAALCQSLGGTLSLESEQGRGTTFHLKVRLGDAVPGPTLAAA